MVKLQQVACVPSDLEAAEISQCLWCGRAFRPRTTGGSAQRFCSTEHRHAFWVAARNWTIRALETGLITVDCPKGGPDQRARCEWGVRMPEVSMTARCSVGRQSCRMVLPHPA